MDKPSMLLVQEVGSSVGKVAEVIDPTTLPEVYSEFCDWLRDNDAMDAWGEFVCVRWLGGDAVDGFYLRRRFRVLGAGVARA